MKNTIVITASKVLAVISILFLTGCSLFQPKEVVVEKKTVIYKGIPEQLLTPCTTTAPPPVKVYMAGSNLDRAKMLTDYSVDLIGDVQKCDKQISSIRDYDAKQRAIFEEKK